MDMPGETYLFNLSLLAVTFAAVSALVMLLRQVMGGRFTQFAMPSSFPWVEIWRTSHPAFVARLTALMKWSRSWARRRSALTAGALRTCCAIAPSARSRK